MQPATEKTLTEVTLLSDAYERALADNNLEALDCFFTMERKQSGMVWVKTSMARMKLRLFAAPDVVALRHGRSLGV